MTAVTVSQLLLSPQPLAEMVTDFVRNNPEIPVLVPRGIPTEVYLADVWYELGINRSRLLFTAEGRRPER